MNTESETKQDLNRDQQIVSRLEAVVGVARPQAHHRTLAVPSAPPLGIQPRTMWIGHAAAKGYLTENFQEAFFPYLPHAELKALAVELRNAQPAGPKAAAEDAVL